MSAAETSPPSGRGRTTVLAQVLAAFAGIQGDLCEADFEWGCDLIEREHGSDLEAAKRALCAELASQQRAVALAEAVMYGGGR